VANASERGYTGVLLLNSDMTKAASANYGMFCGLEDNGEYNEKRYPTWAFPPPEEQKNPPYNYNFTDNTIELNIGGNSNTQYFLSFSVPKANLKSNPIITVNEKIVYESVGTLAENIKVNASSIVGDTSSLIASADAVSYKPQTTNSEERKAQARENIGAVSIDDYNLLLARVEALEQQTG
jgi:hypothetical protein